jgi:phosphate starvation-inducible protein PhoH and related proteins
MQHKRKHKKENNFHNVTNLEPFLELPAKKRNVEITPRNLNQEHYLDLLLDDTISIVLATGPAGTGKTLLAMQAAIRALKRRECDRIIVTRPAVGVEDEKHGFLPGSLIQKMEPWTKPLFDVLHEYYSVREVAHMVENEIIEICPLAFMRGRNFHNCYVIFDEAQNATVNQIKMAMTRVGQNTKMVITGDLQQQDKQFKSDNGLGDFLDRLSQSDAEFIATVAFERADIQRHPVVAEVLSLYGE